MKKSLFLFTSLISLNASNIDVKATIDTMKFDYIECTSTECPFNTEKTNLFDSANGASIGIDYKVDSEYLSNIGAEYQIIKGYTKYTGDYLDLTLRKGYGTIKSYSNITLQTTNIYAQKTNPINYQYDVFLKGSIGYRNWERGLNSTQIETYSWPYTSIGIGVIEKSMEDVTVGAAIYYQRAIDPKMKDTHTGYTFNLGKTDGVKIEIPITYKLSNTLSVIGSYTYDNWNITKSNTINNYYEPDSTTKSHILSVGVIMGF